MKTLSCTMLMILGRPTPLSATRRDTPFSLMLLNVTHDSEHYGNIITYLRMTGIVPPSSQPSR